MKKKRKNNKILNLIIVVGVLLIITILFFIRGLPKAGYAVLDQNSQTIDLDVTNTLPAESVVNFQIENQTIEKTLAELGFESYEITNEQNQTNTFVNLTPISVDISGFGFEFPAGTYDLSVTINETNYTSTFPITFEEVQELIEDPGGQLDDPATIESFVDFADDTIIVGKPVKRKRIINLTKTTNKVSIELPPEADNISVKKIENDQEVEISNFQISDVSKLK